jgi:2-oxoglutarate dehydrogenase E1 component
VNGCFQTVIDDPFSRKSALSLVFCTGRIYYDLLFECEQRGYTDMAIVRIEQLYPFDAEAVQQLIQKYEGFQFCFWVQEEPINMGAWKYIRDQLVPLLSKERQLQCISRPRSSSTAVGSYDIHTRQHAAMMDALFDAKEWR